MKAVVLDITDGEATVMTKAGDIIGVSDRSYDIGQEIMIYDKAEKTVLFAGKISRFMPAIAAAAALLIIIGGGSYAYMKPYGTVSLDVNPSVEYTINMFDRVLDVSGVNDDGNDIIADIDVKKLLNKNIETAVEETIEQIEAEGYFTDEDGNYVVVTANTKQEKHTDELVDKLDKKVAVHENVNSIASKVSDDDIEEAHRQGVSAGKKMMVDRLGSVYDEGFDRDEWNKRSVKDIMGEYDRIQRGERKPRREENMEQFDDTSVPPAPGSEKDDSSTLDLDNGLHNIDDMNPGDNRNTGRPGREIPDDNSYEEGQDNGSIIDRPPENDNRMPENDNRPPENNDRLTDDAPPMDNSRPIDNGRPEDNRNNDMGGQPGPGGGQGLNEPPM